MQMVAIWLVCFVNENEEKAEIKWNDPDSNEEWKQRATQNLI